MFLRGKIKGISICILIAIPSLILGKNFPIIGSTIFALIFGIGLSFFIKKSKIYLKLQEGIAFTSKNILQWAVILLGFGLNLDIILKMGMRSLPIIISTVSVALLVAFLLYKILKLSNNLAILIGVGSSICGGSAIAATAPVIKANDNEIAHSISVIFMFNVIAALIFPSLGTIIGFDFTNPEPFALFAGTAVNDTSSVTATASTWDAMYGLGNATLDKAVTVKLTRTLAIIPITFILAIFVARNSNEGNFSFKKSFPMFIVYFLLASLITTISLKFAITPQVFEVPKMVSKFFIVLAMSAIGLNTDIKQIMKSGYKPIIFGMLCWGSIIVTSLCMQKILGIW